MHQVSKPSSGHMNYDWRKGGSYGAFRPKGNKIFNVHLLVRLTRVVGYFSCKLEQVCLMSIQPLSGVKISTHFNPDSSQLDSSDGSRIRCDCGWWALHRVQLCPGSLFQSWPPLSSWAEAVLLRLTPCQFASIHVFPLNLHVIFYHMWIKQIISFNFIFLIWMDGPVKYQTIQQMCIHLQFDHISSKLYHMFMIVTMTSNHNKLLYIILTQTNTIHIFFLKHAVLLECWILAW